jgi:hypothetical protein
MISSNSTRRFPRRHPYQERFAQISCFGNKRIMQDIAAVWLAYLSLRRSRVPDALQRGNAAAQSRDPSRHVH